jgi:hypothetical protein
MDAKGAQQRSLGKVHPRNAAQRVPWMVLASGDRFCFKQKGKVSNTILLQVKTDRDIQLSADKAGFGICLRLSLRGGPEYVEIEERLITLLVHGPLRLCLESQRLSQSS